MAAKTECVAHTHVNGPFLGPVWCKVQPGINGRVRVIKVNGGGNNAIPDRHDHRNGFDGTCGTQKMAGH